MALKWHQQPEQRVCVVGLDGVPCSMVRRFIDGGVMPRLGEIAGTGTLGDMTVSLPEISSVSWSSFMTGKNPGEHGIFGFTDLHPGTYTASFPSFRDLKTETIWDLIGRHKMRSVVINQPATYPARPIHGTLVSGFVAIHLEKAVFPARHLRTLRDIGYEIDLDLDEVRNRPDLLFPKLHELLKVRERFLDVIWDEEQWNLMQVVVTGTDRLHHFLFDAYENDAHPQHGEFLDYYRAVDAFVGRVYDRFRADNQAKAFFVLSDHGFCRTRAEVNVNTVLAQRGFLAFTHPEGRTLETISERATAFALDPARIYLHKRGKYPRGGVSPEREDALRDEIANVFAELTHEGERVVRHVFHGRDVYSGPEAHHGPDLLLVPEPGFDLKGRVGAPETVAARRLQGMHTWEDAFYATTRADLVPNDRAVTLIDVPRMILEALDVHALAS